jgi:FKBP-type peptidyl-prolyl cis-trans isomerase
MRNYFLRAIPLLILAIALQQCARKDAVQNTEESSESTSTSSPFRPFTIEDSTRIVTYTNGLKIYTVRQGPGEFPRPGMDIVMHYHGMLENGEVFDSSFERDQPFGFRLGQTAVIAGMEQAVEKLRFGSQAVLIIPPALGYSNREDRPPNIPENSTLIFHVDLLGSF